MKAWQEIKLDITEMSMVRQIFESTVRKEE